MINSQIEKEINEIRIKLYEEKKDLTTEDFVKRANETSRKIAEKYGIKISERL